MRRSFICILLISLFFIAYGYADSIENQGRKILEKADARFYPYEGTFNLFFTVDDVDGTHREYALEAYKKGRKSQTVVYTSPEINKNDVGMRCGRVIYYKPSKWPKAEIMSYQSLFMGTGFSWGDVMCSDIALDYKAVKIEEINDNNKQLYYLLLKQKRKDLYARIDIWIDKNTYDTYKRIYYTPSGDKLKEASYSNIIVKNGKVVSFEINMKDYITEAKSYAKVSNIKARRLPSFIFNPQNIGRIHVR